MCHTPDRPRVGSSGAPRPMPVGRLPRAPRGQRARRTAGVGPRARRAARRAGAYEVGVVQYVLEDVSQAPSGRDVPLDVLCGTSAGSINAAMLAAHADEPTARGTLLAERWTDAQARGRGAALDRASSCSWPGGCSVARRAPTQGRREARRGGIFDPSGIEAIVRDAVPLRPHRRPPRGRAPAGACRSPPRTWRAGGRSCSCSAARGTCRAGARDPDDGGPRRDDPRRARARVGGGAAALPRRRDGRAVLLRRRPPPERPAVAGAAPRRRQPHRHQPALHPGGLAEPADSPRRASASSPIRSSSSARR